MLYNPETSSIKIQDELVTTPIIVNGKDTYELCLTLAYYSTGTYDQQMRPRTITVSVENLSGENTDKFIVELSDSTQNNIYNRWSRVSVEMRDISESFRVSISVVVLMLY